MKCFLIFVFLLASNRVLAQDRVDTLYYNRSGRIVRNPAFADYYRIALYPSDSAGHKIFKDFYLSGELRKEGNFLVIDTLDDCRTLFDGEIVSYFKNGRTSEKSYYSGGLLHGEYLRYNEDGSCRMVEYHAGKPIHDYYLLLDERGNTLKFSIADDMPVWESPAVTERFVDYRDDVPWEVYFKNGLTIALTDAIVRDYGKWHRVDVIISNNSLTPIEFNPQTDIMAYSVDEDNIATDLQVWSCDKYMKKVNRSQTWAAVLMGVSEGMASAGTGYSTTTTTGYSSYGGYSSYTTETYNPSAAYQANLASQQRIADFSQAMQDEKQIRKMGYLKKNTIYPGESISGFVHIGWIRGVRAVFVIRIENAEYIYEWGFDKKNAFLMN